MMVYLPHGLLCTCKIGCTPSFNHYGLSVYHGPGSAVGTGNEDPLYLLIQKDLEDHNKWGENGCKKHIFATICV